MYGLIIASNTALNAAVVNSDYWIRLAAGRLVVEEHIIPRHDPFTYTVGGRSWVDHEWLLEGAMYFLNNISYELLVMIGAVAAVAPFMVMHRVAVRYRQDDWLLLTLVAFSVFVSWRALGLRPQLVNPIFFALLVWLVDDFRRAPSARVWLAVPLTLIWANLQAGFLVAPAVIGVWAAASIAEGQNRRISVMVLAGALVVPLINAYGWDLYRYSLEASLSGNTDRALVPEWQTPDFHDFLNLPTLAGLILVAYSGVRSADRFRQLLALGTFAATLISARFVPFFALSLIYVVGSALPLRPLTRRAGLGLWACGGLVSLFAAVAVVGSATNDPPVDKDPVEGLLYLDRSAPAARVFTHQRWGSFMAWRGESVFFDTRTHQVFPESMIEDYHRVERARGAWLDVLDRWRVDYVMMPENSTLGEALDSLGWPRVFEGEIEVIWKRP